VRGWQERERRIVVPTLHNPVDVATGRYQNCLWTDQVWSFWVADPLNLNFGGLVEQRLERARMILGLVDESGFAPVVLDAASGEFVLVPNRPRGPGTAPLALAPDGRTVLLRARREDPGYSGLCQITLATGQRRWFEADSGAIDRRAAMSPDGRTIATVTTDIDPIHPDDPDAGIATVDLIDVATGQRHRHWSTPGGWSQESNVSWSPNGQLVAASYLTMDDQFATIVIDIQTGPLRHYDRTFILSSSNGVWLNDRELTYINDDFDLVADHLDNGARILTTKAGARAVAVVNEQIIWLAPLPQDAESADLLTTDLDKANPRTLVTVRPPRMIVTFDIARDYEQTGT
jgi:hypothetical protein